MIHVFGWEKRKNRREAWAERRKEGKRKGREDEKIRKKTKEKRREKGKNRKKTKNKLIGEREEKRIGDQSSRKCAKYARAAVKKCNGNEITKDSSDVPSRREAASINEIKSNEENPPGAEDKQRSKPESPDDPRPAHPIKTTAGQHQPQSRPCTAPHNKKPRSQIPTPTKTTPQINHKTKQKIKPGSKSEAIPAKALRTPTPIADSLEDRTPGISDNRGICRTRKRSKNQEKTGRTKSKQAWNRGGKAGGKEKTKCA
ncbi:hypothetical protein M413DRAFT_448710 [Hebeloma cylindrosporum]|uniref:Uncharacterized protein n=1 Tax=Hebeloma cylindrosporum TaxID=76867 RepID=A0A0C3C0N1_HEBCY|nr:hypothetical protein M413DRAFT_448710 [Hebeloma cylindrosporum h7]